MIQILIGNATTGYVDYSAFYIGGSFSATETVGADWDTFKIKLDNPTIPPKAEQEIIVWDSPAKLRKMAAGYIKRPGQIPTGAKFNTTTQTAQIGYRYEIQGEGYVRLLERVPAVSNAYQDKTTGFIAKDLLLKFCPTIDSSLVDPLVGPVIHYFAAAYDKLNDVFDNLAKIENRLWYVDRDRKFHFELPGDFMGTWSITDATWQNICGLSLKFEPDTSEIGNQLKMFYKGKYYDGTVATNNGLTGIVGTGTLWATKATVGATFRLANSEKILYTIEQIIDNTHINLSSPYNEAVASGQKYIIENIQTQVNAADTNSQILYAALTGDNGVFADTVQSPGTSMEYSEAIAYLQGVVAARANAPVNTSFATTSYQLNNAAINAGMSIQFQLTDFGNVNTIIQIKQLVITELTQDVNGLTLYQYDVTFEARLYDLVSRLKILEKEFLDTSVDESSYLEDNSGLYESVKITESFAQIVAPAILIESLAVTENLFDIQDNVSFAPFVYAPSVKIWQNYTDWLTWSLVNMTASPAMSGYLGTLSPTGASLTCSATSPWVIQYSRNVWKTAMLNLVAALPVGCTAVLMFRSDDTKSPGAVWQSNIQTLADCKYMQAQLLITRTTGAESIVVNSILYTPNKSHLKYRRSWYTGAIDIMSSVNDFSRWKGTGFNFYSLNSADITDNFSNLITDNLRNTITTNGSLADNLLNTITDNLGNPIGLSFGDLTDSLLNGITDNLGNPIITSGAAGAACASLQSLATTGTILSPWRKSHARMVSKIVNITSSIPPGYLLSVLYRSSPDGTAFSATAWYPNIQDCPDNAWLQIYIQISAIAGAATQGTPSINGITIYPL